MRLGRVERKHRLPQRMILGMIRVFQGRRAPDIVRTLFYRPEYLGKPISTWTQTVMRGPSEWSVAERELFAAFVSRMNQCVF